MKKWIIIFLVFLLFMTLIPTTANSQEILHDSYKSPIGITINSYSPNWTGEKLEEIYKELLKNAHGEEIELLSTINLYPDNPSGGTEEGLYYGAYQTYKIMGKKKVKMKSGRIIDLYNLSDKNSIKDFARTLSHEYGHHFTLYYLIKYENKTFEDWEETQYSQARELSKYPLITNDYSNGHEWNILEIAAEDYVQIFGSLTSKTPQYYDDIIERMNKDNFQQEIIYDYNAYNLCPQENINIPLVTELTNLTYYWNQASGIDNNKSSLSKPYLALTQVIDLGYNKKQYIFEWSKSIDNESEQLLYTLIAYDSERDLIIPIKTVSDNNKLRAVIGSVKISKTNEILFFYDSFINTPKTLKILAMDQYGNIVSSDPLFVDFNKPIISKLPSSQNSYNINEDEKIEFSKTSDEGWLDPIFDFIIEILHQFF